MGFIHLSRSVFALPVILGLSLQLAATVPVLAESNSKPALKTETAASQQPEVFSGIQRFVLPSGQTLWVKEDKQQPIVTVDTWVKTGSVNEDESNNGVSHFLEHLLFKGTKTYKAGEIDRILESKGAKFNAATSDDFTHYYITTASEHFDTAFKLHADMLLNATIPTPELDRERKVVQEEINRATDNPSHKLYFELAKALYPNHGYSLDTLGPKSLIGSIPRESILNYYHYWYRPENINTIVVGNVKAERVKALAEQYFQKKPFPNPKSYAPPKVGPAADNAEPKAVFMDDPNVSQLYLIMGFPAPSIDGRQDAYALDVAMMALGQGDSSRLAQDLRDRQTLVSSVGAANMTQRYGGTLLIQATMKPENLQAARQGMIQHLVDLKENGITQAELDKAKTQTLKDFAFHNEATDGIAQAIGYNVTIGNIQDYTDYVGNIQKVTLDDVQQALDRYLDFSKAAVVAIGPEGQWKAKDEQSATLELLKHHAQPETADTSANQGPKLSPLPTNQVLSRPQAAEQTAPQIIRKTLANGMTLVVKPTPSGKTIGFKMFAKGGQLVEPVPGVAAVLANVMMRGTKHRSADALSETLEGRGINLSISSSDDYMEISGHTVADDLGEFLTILQDVLTNPALSDEEIEKQKALIAQGIKASQDNPSTRAFENLSTTLYPLHPYGNVGKRIESHLPLIKRDMLVDYLHRYLVPSNMVVNVVGPVNADELGATLASLFPSVTPAPDGVNPYTQAEKVAPMTKSQVVTDGQTKQAATWIAMGWQAPSIEDPDYVPMKVLNSLLGSGMSSRLFSGLREKQGLAYVVSSFFPTRKQPSRFVMYIGTDPKNREQVLQGFNSQINDLKTKLVSTKELQEAKDKLTGLFALEHETPLQQAYYLGLFETLGAGFEYDTLYPKLVQKVTAADIQRVARRYFDAPSITSIVAPGLPKQVPSALPKAKTPEASNPEANPKAGGQSPQ